MASSSPGKSLACETIEVGQHEPQLASRRGPVGGWAGRVYADEDREFQNDGVTGPSRSRRNAVGDRLHSSVKGCLAQCSLRQAGLASRRVLPVLAPGKAKHEALAASAQRHGRRDGRGSRCMAAHLVGAPRQRHARVPDLNEQPPP